MALNHTYKIIKLTWSFSTVVVLVTPAVQCFSGFCNFFIQWLHTELLVYDSCKPNLYAYFYIHWSDGLLYAYISHWVVEAAQDE